MNNPDFESVFSDMATRAVERAPKVEDPPPHRPTEKRAELLAALGEWSTVVELMQALGRTKNAIHGQLRLLGAEGLLDKRRQVRPYRQFGAYPMEYRTKR